MTVNDQLNKKTTQKIKSMNQKITLQKQQTPLRVGGVYCLSVSFRDVSVQLPVVVVTGTERCRTALYPDAQTSEKSAGRKITKTTR